MASTIEAAEGEYRRFTETMTQTETMVKDLFTEGLGDRAAGLTVRDRDSLESKFVTILKAKMLTAKDFNFVKAGAEAQQTIMKDLKDLRPKFDRDRVRDRPGGRDGAVPKCYECGAKGHKSFECTADEETRRKHKEARAARRA